MLAHRAKNFETVAVFETEVCEHEVELLVADHLARLSRARRGRDVVAVKLQDRLDRDDNALLVVNDEDLRLLAHRLAPPPAA